MPGLRVLLSLATTVLLAAPLIAQQSSTEPVSEAAQREMQAVQELLVRATAEFEGPQQGRSIAQFDEIIERLEGLRRQGALPLRGREILVQAYEFRGRAYFNVNLQEKASDSFRSLIQLQPQHALSKDRVSPRIVDFFNSVKKVLVGYLAVSSEPPGARVSLNGEFISVTDFFPIEVLAGEYTIEVVRAGYATETRTVSIAPRATETVSLKLIRITASAFFVTEPSGVEVWVDGELKATTGGTLSADRYEEVRARGLEPVRASAATEVANLSLGSHVVELRKKCFEPVRRTMELAEPQNYPIEPVRMEDSLSSLTLQSDPPGARIFVDGEAMGLTPKDLEGICSGKHRIEVKHAAGRFIQDVVLAKNDFLTLDCPIRPSLAFLGTVATTAAAERLISEVDEKLIQNLSKITSLNFVPAPKETVDRILDAEKITRKDLVAGDGNDPDLVRKVTEKLAATLEVQGFLIAVLPEERLQRTAVLNLLAAGNTVPDRWDVSYGEAGSYLRFIAAVDQRIPVFRPWAGLITLDTLNHEGLPVLRTAPDGPAARAGIQPGEVLDAVDGKAVTRTRELMDAVAAAKPKTKLVFQLHGPSGERAVELTLGETPQEIPLNDPTLLYNKVMMDLRQEVEGYPGTESAAYARLNLGLCAMHFADHAAAHEHFLKARSELPVRPGISQGTALYYLGLSFERLGDKYRREAADAYRAAAAFKDATVGNNDGPAVAPLTARRVGQ